MAAFHIDLITIVFVLALINLVATIFVIINGQLTRTGIQLGYFVLAKAFQGLSWILRLIWFIKPLPLASALADLSLLTGLALESILIANFARPLGRRGKRGYFIIFTISSVIALIAGIFNLTIRNLVVLAIFLSLLLFAAWRLFRDPAGGHFQKFIAIMYAILPPPQAVLYVVLGAEVTEPGLSSSPGAIVYYCLLITLQMVGSLGYLLMVKERYTAILRDQASHDALTGVLNRRAFFGIAETLVANASRTGEQVSLIIADLDHFKQINDRHGHQTGDLLLTTFSGTISQSIRQGDLCARFGGDEFVMFLPKSGRETAEMVANRIQQDLRNTFDGATWPLPSCTVSIGIASGRPQSMEDLNRLLAEADSALYAAKQTGRNRIEWRELSPQKNPDATGPG